MKNTQWESTLSAIKVSINDYYSKAEGKFSINIIHFNLKGILIN